MKYLLLFIIIIIQFGIVAKLAIIENMLINKNLHYIQKK